MDDPIQYLDSINVLSFIDLLRTIIIDKTLNKQVVISTHDEVFLDLLKKKFDPGFYRARFLEFDSYGKIKGEIERSGSAVGNISTPQKIAIEPKKKRKKK